MRRYRHTPFPLLGPIRFAGCSSGGTGRDLQRLNLRSRTLHFRERFASWPPRRSPNTSCHGATTSPVYPCLELDLGLVFP